MAVKKKAPKSRRSYQRRLPKTPAYTHNKPDTPTRVRVLDAIKNNPHVPKRTLFKEKFPEMPLNTAYQIARDKKVRSARKINPDVHLGRPPVINHEQEQALYRKVKYGDFNENTPGWFAMAADCGIHGTCYDTIKNHLPPSIKKHPVAMKSWLKDLTKDQHVQFAVEHLGFKEWRKIRFSDETYLGPGPAKRKNVARDAGEHNRLHRRKI